MRCPSCRAPVEFGAHVVLVRCGSCNAKFNADDALVDADLPLGELPVDILTEGIPPISVTEPDYRAEDTIPEGGTPAARPGPRAAVPAPRPPAVAPKPVAAPPKPAIAPAAAPKPAPPPATQARPPSVSTPSTSPSPSPAPATVRKETGAGVGGGAVQGGGRSAAPAAKPAPPVLVAKATSVAKPPVSPAPVVAAKPPAPAPKPEAKPPAPVAKPPAAPQFGAPGEMLSEDPEDTVFEDDPDSPAFDVAIKSQPVPAKPAPVAPKPVPQPAAKSAVVVKPPAAPATPSPASAKPTPAPAPVAKAPPPKPPAPVAPKSAVPPPPSPAKVPAAQSNPLGPTARFNQAVTQPDARMQDVLAAMPIGADAMSGNVAPADNASLFGDDEEGFHVFPPPGARGSVPGGSVFEPSLSKPRRAPAGVTVEAEATGAVNSPPARAPAPRAQIDTEDDPPLVAATTDALDDSKTPPPAMPIPVRKKAGMGGAMIVVLSIAGAALALGVGVALAKLAPKLMNRTSAQPTPFALATTAAVAPTEVPEATPEASPEETAVAVETATPAPTLSRPRPTPTAVARVTARATGARPRPTPTARVTSTQSNVSVQDLEFLTAKADVWLEEKKFANAKQQYLKVLKLNANYGPAHLGLGKTLEAMGDVKGACREWRTYLSVAPAGKGAALAGRKASTCK